MGKNLHLLCGILLLLMAACNALPSPAPLPTPQPVILSYPPELRPYADSIAACARQDPDINIYINESVAPPAEDGQTSLFLAFGAHPEALTSWQATLLATDTLVIIANAQNPLNNLSIEQLRSIWNGDTIHWEGYSGIESLINVWMYQEGSSLRLLFDGVLAGEWTPSQAWLAPDPQAMLEAVSSDPNAIGYISASWLESASPELTGLVHQIRLPNEIEKRVQQPVIALTEADPQDALLRLLLCFQASQESSRSFNSSGSQP